MPWINSEMCTVCEVCINECPVDAILKENDFMVIRDENCIRCGTCHDICPQGAIRHDSEKIPDEIKANVEKAKRSMDSCIKYIGKNEEGSKCLNRIIKYFNKEKVVVERTLFQLEKLRDSYGENS